jgi:hypothetical protein
MPSKFRAGAAPTPGAVPLNGMRKLAVAEEQTAAAVQHAQQRSACLSALNQPFVPALHLLIAWSLAHRCWPQHLLLAQCSRAWVCLCLREEFLVALLGCEPAYLQADAHQAVGHACQRLPPGVLVVHALHVQQLRLAAAHTVCACVCRPCLLRAFHHCTLCLGVGMRG